MHTSLRAIGAAQHAVVASRQIAVRCFGTGASAIAASFKAVPRHAHKVAVILKEQLDNLGYKGEEVTVAPGYARNFLIPKGKAVYATENARNTVKVVLSEDEAKAIGLQREINMLKERIASVVLSYSRTTTDGVTLYSGVTPADIVESLNGSVLKKLGIKEKSIRFATEERVIKVAGTHKIEVEPRAGLWAPMTVIVESG